MSDQGSVTFSDLFSWCKQPHGNPGLLKIPRIFAGSGEAFGGLVMHTTSKTRYVHNKFVIQEVGLAAVAKPSSCISGEERRVSRT